MDDNLYSILFVVSNSKIRLEAKKIIVTYYSKLTGKPVGEVSHYHCLMINEEA